ncbi:MAG: DUF6465 family protein [Clostridiales bacterium]|nr:hypothetical protein [Clostridiales bacterium]MDU3242973.1 DUF6465 family protein [Clostridiales bacterium]
MAKKRHLKKKNKMMTGNVIENETREETNETKETKKADTAAVTVSETSAAVKETAAARTEEVQTGIPKKEEATAVKKRASKKTNFYVQFQDAEYNEQDIIAQVKKIWKDAGNRIADLNTMDIYVKPEEKMVYYTINEELSASFAL